MVLLITIAFAITDAISIAVVLPAASVDVVVAVATVATLIAVVVIADTDDIGIAAPNSNSVVIGYYH